MDKLEFIIPCYADYVPEEAERYAMFGDAGNLSVHNLVEAFKARRLNIDLIEHAQVLRDGMTRVAEFHPEVFDTAVIDEVYAALHAPRPLIMVTMNRADGSEEGNQWEFTGTDDELYDLFELLCRIIINAREVKLPS